MLSQKSSPARQTGRGTGRWRPGSIKGSPRRYLRDTVAVLSERRGRRSECSLPISPLTSILSPQVMGEAEKIDTVAKAKLADSRVARRVRGRAPREWVASPL